MKYYVIASFAIISAAHANAQDTIRLHFLYGSKPAKAFRDSEAKYFGGIKGGHVNIEAGERLLDFMPGKCPIFPNNKNPSGGYRISRAVYWDLSNDKWLTVEVPVTPEQYSCLNFLFDSFSRTTPYDYAVFGMRCAAASYDVLSKIGVWEELPNHKNIARHFYPKLLRKKTIRLARKNNWRVIRHEGHKRRRWEKDKGII